MPVWLAIVHTKRYTGLHNVPGIPDSGSFDLLWVVVDDEGIVEPALGDGEAVMSHEKTILVVGLVAEDDASTEFLSQEAFADFAEQSVYEVVMRLRTGKALPDHLMITVSFQEELLELVSAVEGKGIRLAMMTDERRRAKPENVAELLAYLPKSAPKGNASHLFPIL